MSASDFSFVPPCGLLPDVNDEFHAGWFQLNVPHILQNRPCCDCQTGSVSTSGPNWCYSCLKWRMALSNANADK